MQNLTNIAKPELITGVNEKELWLSTAGIPIIICLLLATFSLTHGNGDDEADPDRQLTFLAHARDKTVQRAAQAPSADAVKVAPMAGAWLQTHALQLVDLLALRAAREEQASELNTYLLGAVDGLLEVNELNRRVEAAETKGEPAASASGSGVNLARLAQSN
ncbi:hypothetical protein [Halioxenophilus sp. WMMB6]|uniref:hypothetical protein n=1 Tax=Halioxenophilus sp. WMMB6 TaxID=3073815 RepID=UPI00295F2EE1|nr:hypothetical protein [Halioxenophilus sp. WMMB6]